MNWLSSLLGGGVAKPIDALGNVFDKLFTSDEERLAAEAVLKKLEQHPAELQVELNKIEAGHRSVFVAGWRPAIGWVCAAGLAMYFLPQYGIASYLWITTVLKAGALVPFPATADGLFELVIAMLGMGSLRSLEKLSGRAK